MPQPNAKVPQRIPLVTALALVAGTALSGCASTEAGFGLPTLTAGEAEAAIDRADTQPEQLSGTIALETNGCFTWTSTQQDAVAPERAWIVWPEGFRQDGAVVVLDSGERVGDGDAVAALAAPATLADLPDGAAEDSYFGSFGLFCGADDSGVVILQDVTVR